MLVFISISRGSVVLRSTLDLHDPHCNKPLHLTLGKWSTCDGPAAPAVAGRWKRLFRLCNL